MGKRDVIENGKGRVRGIVINFIRVILVFAFIAGFRQSRLLLLYMAVFGFILTFVPGFVEKKLKTKIPAFYEAVIILFIYASLFVAEVRGFFGEFWFGDVMLNMASALALGFIGLSVLYVLHKDQKINASPFIIAVFSFSFAVAIGSVWEIFEFSLDNLFGFNMQKSDLIDTMKDLIVNSVGASVVAMAGYFYIKNGRVKVISSLIERVIEKNPKWFKSKGMIDASPDKIIDLIEKGESKNLEFKSTLRTNIHTNQIDKRIEHSVLKTIVAYLNSHKGTLLVGVGDKGEIYGVEKDNFESKDKINLHFTNLIKNHIGTEYLPFIKFDLVPLRDKSVLRIDCEKSRKHVFLRLGGEEEFFVRNGPSSIKLSGSSLIDYINHQFNSREG